MSDIYQKSKALQELLAGAPLGSDGRLAEASLACVAELLACGEHSAARDLLASVVIDPSAAPSLRLAVHILWVRVYRAQRRHQAALDLIHQLRSDAELLSNISEDALIELRVIEANCHWQTNRVEEALAQLLAVRNELLKRPDSWLLALCSLEISAAELLKGNLSAARDMAVDAAISSRRANRPDYLGAALTNAARVDRSRCHWQSAESALEGAASAFESIGDRPHANEARRARAVIAWKRGHLDVATQLCTQCLNESRALSPRNQRYALLLMSAIHLHEGNYGDALSKLTADEGWDAPQSTSRPSLLSAEFAGDVYVETGNVERALSLYDDVLAKAMALVPSGDIVAEVRRRRAECYVFLERLEEGYAEAVAGLRHCEALGELYEIAATHRILALSAAALGRPDEAHQWFRAGFDHYEEIETPYEWGKLWLAYGDWLSGDKAGAYASDSGAMAAYQSAFDLFDRMGAQARRKEAEQRIEALTARSDVTVEISRPVEGPAPPRPRRRPNSEIEKRSRWAFETLGILTRDRGLLAVVDDVEKVAKSRRPVLVVGESGTGKELIASALHDLSGRSGTYMPINCAAIPREIIESELFGHLAGSFTGSTRDKAGLLEVCDKGTVFLDEIGEMPLELQARLLRFLETGELRRVGSTKNQLVTTRVVTATNVDLSTLESGENFRRDLFYRLAHLVIELPPLRARRADIALLAEHFLREASSEEGKSLTLGEAAVERLHAYSWPGNVRQLRSEMSRLALLLPDGHVVRPTDLRLRDADTPGSLTEEIGQAEKRRVADAMDRARGSKSEAAKALGIPRTTLINKLKRYGLFR